MRKIGWLMLAVTVFVTTICLGGCGGGGGGNATSTSSGTSLVSISVGQNTKTATLKIESNTLLAQAKILARQVLRFNTAYAAIPAEVQKMVFTVSAPDMTTKTENVMVTNYNNDLTITFIVPNGKSRLFSATAYNTGGKIIYQSPNTQDYTKDLSGEPVSVTFYMAALSPLGSEIIIGAITDATTKAVLDSATVTITRVGETTPFDSTTTSLVGKYLFQNLTVGDYLVSVSKGSYSTATVPLHVVAQPVIKSIQEQNVQLFPYILSPAFTNVTGLYKGTSRYTDTGTGSQFQFPFSARIDAYGNVTGRDVPDPTRQPIAISGLLTPYFGNYSSHYVGTASDGSTWTGSFYTATKMFSGRWSGGSYNYSTTVWEATKSP